MGAALLGWDAVAGHDWGGARPGVAEGRTQAAGTPEPSILCRSRPRWRLPAAPTLLARRSARGGVAGSGGVRADGRFQVLD
jgi:hypothetical protein